MNWVRYYIYIYLFDNYKLAVSNIDGYQKFMIDKLYGGRHFY